MLRLANTRQIKQRATPRAKPTMFSRQQHIKQKPTRQEIEAYKEACERVENDRICYQSRNQDFFTPAPGYREFGVTQKTWLEWRQLEEKSFNDKLDKLFPFPPKPPGL